MCYAVPTSSATTLFSGSAWQAARLMSVLMVSALLGCGGGGDVATTVPEARETGTTGDNVVVSAVDAGTSTQGTFERGTGYLSRSAQVLRSSGQGVAVATLTTTVGRGGFYEVFAWWPQAEAGAGEAQVAIQHAGGQTTAKVDQRVLAGQWNSLGLFEFGPSASARISFIGIGNSRMVVDAVRLQWVGVERPRFTLATDTLPVGLKDMAYRASLATSGGTAPYRYSVSGGALPPGLTLNSESGTLEGIAAQAGRFGFKVTAMDANGAHVSHQLEVFVDDTAAANSEPQGMPLTDALQDQRRRRMDAGSGSASLNNLLAIVAALPEGGWSKVNMNSFSDVWAPADLRPLMRDSNPTPSKIILAWSSFAWDSNRSSLFLYGGGHANYTGNDTYLWRGETQMWERASLPSQMVKDDLSNTIAIDGSDKAPASAHTYDNTLFFPVLDRMLVLGGASVPLGGHFLTQDTATTSRKTGPYLFDPSRAHPNRVGGSTGSHVQRVAPYPEIVGGNMWSNRESWLHANANSAPPSHSFVNGCSGYAQEDGLDVAYVRTAYSLYRYRIFDLGNPAADRWERVGRYYAGSGAQAACSYDTQRKVFVSTNRNTAAPFNYWNLNTPGPKNNEAYFTPTDPSGNFAQLLASKSIDIRYCGIEFDPRRADHKLWCGDGRVWTLTPPAGLGTNGWVINQNAPPGTAVPNGGVGTGILGKWKYIPNLDVFMGLQDPVLGNIWVYKPVGWVNPSGGNLPPSAVLSSPSNGAAYGPGASIQLNATALDRDGSVSKVEFLANGKKIGEAVSPPYQLIWASPPAGLQSLAAKATDDEGSSAVSAPVNITVLSDADGGGTVTLQRGTVPGAQVADTYLSSYHKTLNFGSVSNMQDQQAYYSNLLRFAIFQSEGGPIPDGAQIRSAKLSVYKYSSYNMLYGLHRMLQEWSEAAATWNQRLPGLPWATAGANGPDADFATTVDATAITGFDPEWIDFDLTASVSAMSTASPKNNFGWRLRSVSGNSNLKRIYASDYAADPTLRPKLVISYE